MIKALKQSHWYSYEHIRKIAVGSTVEAHPFALPILSLGFLNELSPQIQPTLEQRSLIGQTNFHYLPGITTCWP